MRGEDEAAMLDDLLRPVQHLSSGNGTRPVVSEGILAGLEKLPEEPLSELVPVGRSIPYPQEVASVDAELHARKDSNAKIIARLLEDGIPIDSVVVGDGEDRDPGLCMSLEELSSERVVGFPATGIAVALLMIRWRVYLEVAEVEAGVRQRRTYIANCLIACHEPLAVVTSASDARR